MPAVIHVCLQMLLPCFFCNGELLQRRIHRQCQHEQEVIAPFVGKYFGWIIWLHGDAKLKAFFM